MASTAVQRYRYSVDEHDCLNSVSPAWLAFAQENGAPQLTAGAVLGRKLWGFIHGPETVRLYQTVLQHVRSSLRPMVLPFRCDSPTLRRYMRLEIVADPSGAVQFAGIVERVEPTRWLAVLDAPSPRSNELLTLCSSCKRALVETIGWLEIDDAATRLHLFEKEESPQLAHAVCPDCLARAQVAAWPGEETRTLGGLPA